MKTTKARYLSTMVVGIAALLTACAAGPESGPSADLNLRIGENDLGGVVAGAQGPEAGVWVIAETSDLPTKFAKIVVTDDRGRFVMPDLPKATYSVWVRGYGLVDSPKLRTTPGRTSAPVCVSTGRPAHATRLRSMRATCTTCRDTTIHVRRPRRRSPS